MELSEFIGMEKPWEYNFERECPIIGENFKSDGKILERFFTYKAMNVKPAEKKDIVYPEAEIFIRQARESGYPGFDCDRCSLFIHISTVLWKDKLGKGFGTDTMNSAITPLSMWTKTLNDDQKSKAKGNLKSNKYLLECFLGENREAYKQAMEQAGIEAYIDSCHMLGNFVLVPAGFNTYRNKRYEDFFDLSLNGLNGDKDKHKEEVVIFDKEKFSWYVNYFFLWDFVDVKGNSYEVKPIGMEELNGKKRDLLEFFEITTRIIDRRGRFMTAMLMIQAKKIELYTSIQEALCIKNNICGVDGAAEKILETEEFKEIPKGAKEILEGLKAEGKCIMG